MLMYNMNISNMNNFANQSYFSLGKYYFVCFQSICPSSRGLCCSLFLCSTSNTHQVLSAKQLSPTFNKLPVCRGFHLFSKFQISCRKLPRLYCDAAGAGRKSSHLGLMRGSNHEKIIRRLATTNLSLLV